MATITVQNRRERRHHPIFSQSRISKSGLTTTVITTNVVDSATEQLKELFYTVFYGHVEHCYPFTNVKYDADTPRSDNQQASRRRRFVNKNAKPGLGRVTPGGSSTVNTDAKVPGTHAHTPQTTSKYIHSTQSVKPSQSTHKDSLLSNADSENIDSVILSIDANVQNVLLRQNKVIKERTHFHEQPHLTDEQKNTSRSLKPEIGTESAWPESKICVQSKGSGHSLFNLSKLKNTKHNKNREKGVPKSISIKGPNSRTLHEDDLKGTPEIQAHESENEKKKSGNNEDIQDPEATGFDIERRAMKKKTRIIVDFETPSEDKKCTPILLLTNVMNKSVIESLACKDGLDDTKPKKETPINENDESKDKENNTKTIQNPSTENQAPVIIVRPGPCVNEIVYDNPLVRR